MGISLETTIGRESREVDLKKCSGTVPKELAGIQGTHRGYILAVCQTLRKCGPNLMRPRGSPYVYVLSSPYELAITVLPMEITSISLGSVNYKISSYCTGSKTNPDRVNDSRATTVGVLHETLEETSCLRDRRE